MERVDRWQTRRKWEHKEGIDAISSGNSECSVQRSSCFFSLTYEGGSCMGLVEGRPLAKNINKEGSLLLISSDGGLRGCGFCGSSLVAVTL